MVNKKDLKMLDVLVNKATKRRVVNKKHLKMLDVFVCKIAERVCGKQNRKAVIKQDGRSMAELKEVLRREIQGLKVYPVDGS